MRSAKGYEIDMVNGPLLGKIMLFYVPLMLSAILQLLFNAADIMVVLHDGDLFYVESIWD